MAINPEIFYKAGKAAGTDPYQGVGFQAFSAAIGFVDEYLENAKKKKDDLLEGVQDIDLSKVNSENVEATSKFLHEQKEIINEAARTMALYGNTKKGREATERFNKAQDAILNANAQLKSYSKAREDAIQNDGFISAHTDLARKGDHLNLINGDLGGSMSYDEFGNITYQGVTISQEGVSTKATKLWKNFKHAPLVDNTVGEGFKKLSDVAVKTGNAGIEFSETKTRDDLAVLLGGASNDQLLSYVYNSMPGEAGVSFIEAFLTGMLGLNTPEEKAKVDTFEEQKAYYEVLKQYPDQLKEQVENALFERLREVQNTSKRTFDKKLSASKPGRTPKEDTTLVGNKNMTHSDIKRKIFDILEAENGYKDELNTGGKGKGYIQKENGKWYIYTETNEEAVDADGVGTGAYKVEKREVSIDALIRAQEYGEVWEKMPKRVLEYYKNTETKTGSDYVNFSGGKFDNL